jgi:esterase/lipase superfamily enzyme
MAAPRPPADSAAYAIVRPFFATNRKRIGADLLKASFGGERGVLTYGTCEVSIPRYHRVGQLESPSIWRFEFREDPARHVVLMSVSTKPKAEYFAQLTRSIAAARQRTAFVFVHGYNVSFEDAARRTAQMSYDLGYQGVPVFFSWPSQSSLSAYTVDEQNIEWAEVGLQSFLHDFLAQSGVAEVVLIAHSMGNRGLTRTLAAVLRENPALRSKVKEIILAAPDIDADVFRDQIAPALIEAQRPITLYASSKDLALSASRGVHGAARAGDSGLGLIIFPGIETIDATDVDTSLLGHSYIGDSPTVISDMTSLIREGLRADKRVGLSVVEKPGGRYWAVTH